MFVVRIWIEGQVSNTKGFANKRDAEAYFWTGWHQIEGTPGASALHELPNAFSVSDAVSAVRNGRLGVMLLSRPK
jgi:hypothetical protein